VPAVTLSPKFHHVLLFLYADLKVIFIHVRSQSNEAVDVLLTPDDGKCLEILHLHNVDLHKLEMLKAQSVNQADVSLGNTRNALKAAMPNRMPTQLAKAFLNGVFSGTIAHLTERQRATGLTGFSLDKPVKQRNRCVR
jgi:hypothetical protein